MKEYYYLDINRKVHGPHTMEELAALLKSGTVDRDTEVSAPGDERWVPLGSLEMPEAVSGAKLPPIPAMAGAPGKCPSCASELKTEEGALPVRCPQCGRVLRSAKGGFLGNLVLPLRQYAKFSGRATRAEYWIFTLITLVLIYALFIGGMVISFAAMMEGSAGLLKWGVLIALGGVAVVCLVLIVPLMSVQVRRLHDAGFSGWWWGAAFLCSLVSTVGVHIVCRDEQEQMKQLMMQRLQENGGDWLQAIDVALESAGSPAMTAFSLVSWVGQMLCLVVFVLSFFDSQRGPNKYGPSRKYPMG